LAHPAVRPNIPAARDLRVGHQGGRPYAQDQFLLFTTGALFVLAGVGLGIWMGMKENFTLAPVHAHINLIGWASMGLIGAFYAVAGDAAPRKLGWTIYLLQTLGLLVMIPMLAKLLLGDKSVVPFLGVSEMMVALALLLFLVSVLITWSRSRAGSGAALTAAMPAE
jgi:hypothetical protein